MSERTLVHVVRHGEVRNPAKILYGRLPDFHLSELGRAMAGRVADQLADHDITYVVASPLDRAQETAAPIAARHGLTVVSDPDLLEATNVFEGLTFGVGDGSLRRPTHWKHLRNPIRPSWGEPYVELAARMRAAVEAARDAATGHEAVVVSHQLPIEILRRSLTGEHLWHRPDRRMCALASITTIAYDGEALADVSYADHCAGMTVGPSIPGA
ncbi:MAG: phosphoglycerate mutase [Frankiales bacterium]|nr:phosphoglycerate mutase [Frankiales bacterium]